MGMGCQPYVPAVLYPQERFVILILYYRLSQLQGHSAAGRIR
jgi:hypothetical protein